MELITLDVTSTISVNAAFAEVSQKTNSLDIIIENAGVWPLDFKTPLEEIDVDDFLTTIDINAVGCMRVAKAFLPLLRKGKDKVFTAISTEGGSFFEMVHQAPINEIPQSIPYAYTMSKAALNMGAWQLQRYVKKDGIKVLCIHPGRMATRMAGGDLPPEEAAASIREVITTHTGLVDGHFFYDWTGKAMPY